MSELLVNSEACARCGEKSSAHRAALPPWRWAGRRGGLSAPASGSSGWVAEAGGGEGASSTATGS